MTDLTKKKCVPCEGGVPPLNEYEIKKLLLEIDGWNINDEGHLVKDYQFKDFLEALNYVNKIGELAENDGHHPNIYIHDWNRLRLELYTHAISGLSENDFILAAKINEIDS